MPSVVTIDSSGDLSAVTVAAGLTGATAASRYVGATTSGAPSSGTFAVGDFTIDQSGGIWICTAAGTPGTWVNLCSPWLSGEIRLTASITVPSGWLACDGSAVSRTTYSALFSAITIALTGNTHSSTTVDNLASTTNLAAGMAISGSGIPANTVIATIVNSTSITISNAATTTVTGNALTFYPWGAGNGSSTFNVPDLRGRAAIGSGTGAGGGSSGQGAPSGTALTNRVIGGWLGEETHSLTYQESGLPSHSHGITDPGHTHDVSGSYGVVMNTSGSGPENNFDAGSGSYDFFVDGIDNNSTGITVSASSTASASSAHNNIEPVSVVTYVIKT